MSNKLMECYEGLLRYSNLLSSANELLLDKYNEPISEDFDTMLQDLEAFNYNNKIINEANKLIEDLKIERCIIVLLDYVIPQQEDILKRWHDTRIGINNS